MTCLSILNSKIVQILLKHVLRRKACIGQIALFSAPLMQPAIVKQLHIVVDDERHNTVAQALLEHDKPSDTTVAILEWVDRLKADVEVDDLLKRFVLRRIVLGKQLLDLVCDLLRRSSFLATQLVWHPLVIAYGKPV